MIAEPGILPLFFAKKEKYRKLGIPVGIPNAYISFLVTYVRLLHKISTYE